MAKFSLCKDEDIYAISRKDDKLLIILRHEKLTFSYGDSACYSYFSSILDNA